MTDTSPAGAEEETLAAEKPAKPARRRRLLGNRRAAVAAKPEKQEPADAAEDSSGADDVDESVAGANDTASDKPVETDPEADGVTQATDEAEPSGETEAAGEARADAAETAGEFEADAAAAEAKVDAAEPEQPTKPVRQKKLTGKRLAAVAALVASLLFVGSAAFAGATVQPYLADRATVAVKLKVARTAANAITTLWTYTPENMDTLADRAANYLSGDFGAQYRKFVDSIVAPNKQAKVTNSTEVTGVAVESLEGDNAVAIVYTNTTTTSPLTKNIPAMKYLSYRLILRRDNDRWLVTRMTTITSLDLTPRL